MTCWTSCLLALLFYLFSKHNVLPDDFYRQSAGSQQLLQVFSGYEAENEDSLWWFYQRLRK